MSLVGTRPILPDELEQYELHHRARIAIKPGMPPILDPTTGVPKSTDSITEYGQFSYHSDGQTLIAASAIMR